MSDGKARELASLLRRYVERGDLAQARQALAMGADPDAKDSQGRSAVLVAAYSDQPMALRLLLEAGASPLAFDNEGDGALWLACSAQSAACVRLLLAAGAPADHVQESASLFTPLIVAALNGATECARLLAKAGARLEAEGMERMRPLHFAARCLADSGLETVQALVEAGAELNPLDRRFLTPLDCAYESACPEAFAFLLSAGARGKCLEAPAGGPAPFPFSGFPGRQAQREECERALRAACERRDLSLALQGSAPALLAKRPFL